MGTAKYEREWRKKNPTKTAGYLRRYKERHPERVKEQRAKQKAKYVLKGRCYGKYCKVSKEEYRQKATLNARKWREKNREKVREANRRSYRNNRETHRLHSINYKSRVRAGRDGTIGYKALQELEIKQKGKCAICGGALGKNKELDHIKPIIKGGKHTIKNVQWTCRRCNRSKRDNYGK